jgi:hypothetical protein
MFTGCRTFGSEAIKSMLRRGLDDKRAHGECDESENSPDVHGKSGVLRIDGRRRKRIGGRRWIFMLARIAVIRDGN